MKSIHQQVKEIRLAKGWTQERLANESGLVQEAISRFENGEKGATMGTLSRLATALGKEIEFTELAEPNLVSSKKSNAKGAKRPKQII